jgi:parallel beta-helix repeat protein
MRYLTAAGAMMANLLFALLFIGLVFPAAAKTILVHPGGSIRTAVQNASAGDTIKVFPGIYYEGSPGDLNALTITKKGISLVGLSSPEHPVVLANVGAQSFGIWASPSDAVGPSAQADPEDPPCGTSGNVLHGFSLAGFTISGFVKHGVHLACVDGFELRRNVAANNAVYGLFPIVSRNGAVSNNEVRRTSNDAGIYIGQSDNILIMDNWSHDNLIGIEVENSRNCAVFGNLSSDNTIGIIVDLLPFLLKKTQHSTVVSLNTVQSNNRLNTAEAGDIIAAIPSGTGILLLGADTTSVRANEISGNKFTGIAVASVCTGLAQLGLPCTGLDIDPNPDQNKIIGNRLTNNGTAPSPLPIPPADLLWDGKGARNCWSLNRYSTSFPATLPRC